MLFLSLKKERSKINWYLLVKCSLGLKCSLVVFARGNKLVFARESISLLYEICSFKFASVIHAIRIQSFIILRVDIFN